MLLNIKTNKDLVFASVVAAYLLAAILIVIFVKSLDGLQLAAYGLTVGLAFVMVGLIMAKESSKRFRNWLEKPLKKDEEK